MREPTRTDRDVAAELQVLFTSAAIDNGCEVTKFTALRTTAWKFDASAPGGCAESYSWEIRAEVFGRNQFNQRRYRQIVERGEKSSQALALAVETLATPW